MRVVSRLRPRRDDQARAALGEMGPDLLGDVWHHRMQQPQQTLEGGNGGRARVGVAVIEARLHRFRVPVAKVVERQVVELADEM